MNWASWEVSEMNWWEKDIAKVSSRGVSIRTTRSSKYSSIPLNCNWVRAERRVRVGGGGGRCSMIGKDSGDSKSRISVSSLVNAEKHETIASGEIYPEWDTLKSRR